MNDERVRDLLYDALKMEEQTYEQDSKRREEWQHAIETLDTKMANSQLMIDSLRRALGPEPA